MSWKHIHAVTKQWGWCAWGYHVCFVVLNIFGHAWMVGAKIRWRARKWRSCSQKCKVPSKVHELYKDFEDVKSLQIYNKYVKKSISPWLNVRVSNSDMRMNVKLWRQQDKGTKSGMYPFFSLKWPLVLKPGNYAKICQTHTKATCEPKFLWVFILTKLNIDFVVQASSFTLSFCGMRLILFLKSLILIWQLWENKLTSCKSINTYLATHRYVNVLVFK